MCKMGVLGMVWKASLEITSLISQLGEGEV